VNNRWQEFIFSSVFKFVASRSEAGYKKPLPYSSLYLWQAQTQEGKTEEVKAAPVSNNKWEGTTFAQDQDGKMTAKFKRLMGIKDAGGMWFLKFFSFFTEYINQLTQYTPTYT
jgi:hypothetical protein